MKLLFLALVMTLSTHCATGEHGAATEGPSARPAAEFESGYAPVNGLKMYYEIHGRGEPLVLLHGGGSTIGTSFGRVLPIFAQTRKVIAIEEQAHGHTGDIDRPLTFEQSADDVAALLKHLRVEKADIMGFSNGGNVAMELARRHPRQVRKLIVVSSMTRRDGVYPQFWTFMKKASLENMPKGLQDAYVKVAPNPQHLPIMHDKCVARMLKFKDWKAKDVAAIRAPTLVMIGDADIVRPEHALDMARKIPKGRLAILPGAHGEFLGEVTVAKPGSRVPGLSAALIDEFLSAP